MATLRARAVELFFDHLRFIESSARAFDQGDEKEALRIAVSLRVLFHQTNRSEAVLNTLNALDCEMVSSFTQDVSVKDWEVRDGNKVTRTIFSGQISIGFGQWGQHLPRKDFRRKMKAREWWDANVFQLQDKVFCRGEIVCWIANKDGGAHLDSLPWAYESIEQILSAVVIDPASGEDSLLPFAPIFRLMRESANDLLHSTELHDFVKGLGA